MRTVQLFLLAVAACGGKTISGDAADPAPSVDPTADPSVGTTESAPPGDRDLDGEESCRIVCANLASCGSADATCLSRCHDDVASASCGAAATTYFSCWAGRADGCGLSDACHSSACAWAECTGRELPSYCR